jgi:AmmeMemoRadiSam system protein A
MTYSYILEADERKELLRIARATVKEYLSSGRMPPGAPHRPSLVAPAAVFVSFHEVGRAEGEGLRGCIGTTNETQPIYKAVQEMAVAAASRDPRFPPLKLDELLRMGIEISVLGPRTPVRTPEEVTIGEHGLVVANRAQAAQRGLLLPKVAVEHGWSAADLFAFTCEKAGLPRSFWESPDAVIERFTAQVFDEKSLAVGPYAPPKD